jgi:hypothetical protein
MPNDVTFVRAYRDHRFVGIHMFDPMNRCCYFCGVQEIVVVLLGLREAEER